MSRAFVTENDSWDYCTKAGDTCLHAERGRECTRQDCEFVEKADAAPDRETSSARDD